MTDTGKRGIILAASVAVVACLAVACAAIAGALILSEGTLISREEPSATPTKTGKPT